MAEREFINCWIVYPTISPEISKDTKILAVDMA